MIELKINKHNINHLVTEVRNLTNSTEKHFRVTIKEWKSSRSLGQNAMFHKWVGELSKYLITGGRVDSSPAFCKELFKHTFLGYEQVERVNAKTGERVVLSSLKHTSSCDTGEMTHFMNKCYEWCVSIGLLLTIPEDSEYAKLMERQIS